MEPRSIERGKSGPIPAEQLHSTASMEPRSIERGKGAARSEAWLTFLGFNGAAIN